MCQWQTEVWESERAGEGRRDRAAEGGGESECERVVSALYIALPVCMRSSFPVFSLSLSLIHAHGNTQTRTHRPREGEWESERENTSQPRCSRRFFEVRCLVVCLPSGEWEWEGETFSSDLSLSSPLPASCVSMTLSYHIDVVLVLCRHQKWVCVWVCVCANQGLSPLSSAAVAEPRSSFSGLVSRSTIKV